MNPEEAPESPTTPPQTAAVQHISEAHHLLERLRERLDKHPELEAAIDKLELALSILTTGSGGLL